MRELLVLLAIAAAILLTITILDRNEKPEKAEFNVVCLDGVEYWYRQVGYKAVMAVKYNSDGTIAVCDG